MLEKMREIIAEQLSCDEGEINLETSFKDYLGADSLDLFELVMALEDEYSVEIPAEELQELTTVGSVIDYLKSNGTKIGKDAFGTSVESYMKKFAGYDVKAITG